MVRWGVGMKYFETLFKVNPLKVELDAPLVLQETAIIKDTVDDKILLRNIFVNVANQDIVAIAIKGTLKDIFGENVKYNGQDEFTYVYQDIICEPNTIFGNKISIDLPRDARKIEVVIEKVVLLDGTVWKSNPENIVTIQRQHEIEASDEFINSYDTNSILPIFYYVENDSCWQCTCGQVNKVSDEYCKHCSREKKYVKTKFTKESIAKEYQDFIYRKEHKEELQEKLVHKVFPDAKPEEMLEKPKQEVAYHKDSRLHTDGFQKYKHVIINITILLLAILAILIGVFLFNHSTVAKSRETIENITDLFGTQLNTDNLDENGWENKGDYELCDISGTVCTASITYSKKVQYVYWFSDDECNQTEYENFLDELSRVLEKQPQEDDTYDYRWEFDDYYVYGYKNPNNIICAIFCSVDEDDW